jgi:hypothetical protein
MNRSLADKTNHWPSERKKIWAYTRALLEIDKFKRKRYGGRRRSHWTLFERSLLVFAVLLRACGLYNRGVRNAKTIRVNEIALAFESLPAAFDGYRILHLTDLHLDCVPGMAELICDCLQGQQYDLCLITGDLRRATHGAFRQILAPLKTVISALHAADGIVATLGNHDSYLMVSDLEKMGVRVLANESIALQRGRARITLTGLDDPHYYYTDQVMVALAETEEGFKIVMAHSPELYDIALEHGYQFYLCGHTHGGQICIPGGIPVITHLNNGRRLFRGLWRAGDMAGYTSQGCGSSGIPVRFNTRSEITLFTLRCGSSGSRGSRPDNEYGG